MSTKQKILVFLAMVFVLLFALGVWLWRGDVASLTVDEVSGTDPVLEENPSAESIPTVSVAKPVGWDEGQTPHAADGLTVSRFAQGLNHPRTMLVLPNGDVLVAETNAPAGQFPPGLEGWIAKQFMSRAGAAVPSPDRITLLRDNNGDGKADQSFVLREGLSSPSGMAWHDGKLYVANHDALLSFDYELGATKVTGEPKKLMDLPPAGNHWMRNIVMSEDGKRVYVAVGSNSNAGERGAEADEGRAMIWEYDIGLGRPRVYGAGMRNPAGMAWSPWTGELWTVVQERDMLGSDLVPDYLTNVPVGAQYGYPWVYWRKNFDFRAKAPVPQFLTEYTRKPEYALGPHVSALGLVFSSEGNRMGEAFSNGAFIALHGSWNRKPPSGYEVVFVKFDARGNPQGLPIPVLDGFLISAGKTHGRPTWLAWAKDGALLVTDDTAGIIWRVLKPSASPAPKPEAAKSTPLPPQRELHGGATATFKQDYIKTD